MEVKEGKRKRLLTPFQMQIAGYIQDAGIFDNEIIDRTIAIFLDGKTSFKDGDDVLGDFSKHFQRMNRYVQKFEANTEVDEEDDEKLRFAEYEVKKFFTGEEFAKLSEPKEFVAFCNAAMNTGGTPWNTLQHGKFTSLEHVLKETATLLNGQIREVLQEYSITKGNITYQFDLDSKCEGTILKFRVGEKRWSEPEWVASIHMKEWETLEVGVWKYASQ